MPDNIVILDNQESTSIIQQKYKCLTHGEVIASLKVIGEQMGDMVGDYCMVCWVKFMLSGDVQKLEKIQ